jgi:hypothetical protein
MVSSKDIQKARRMALRKRAASACESCKVAKSKCNDFRPCSRCIRNDDESCAPLRQQSDKNPLLGSQTTASIGAPHVVSDSSDSNFGVSCWHSARSGALPCPEGVTEHTDNYNPIKRQRISNLVPDPSFMLDPRSVQLQAGLPFNWTPMPPLFDLGLGAMASAASEMQRAYSARPLYPPSLWSATPFPPPTQPKTVSPSTFAGSSHVLAPLLSIGIGNSYPSFLTGAARLHHELRLAGRLHD